MKNKVDALVSFMTWLFKTDRDFYNQCAKKLDMFVSTLKGGKNNG